MLYIFFSRLTTSLFCIRACMQYTCGYLLHLRIVQRTHVVCNFPYTTMHFARDCNAQCSDFFFQDSPPAVRPPSRVVVSHHNTTISPVSYISFVETQLLHPPSSFRASSPCPAVLGYASAPDRQRTAAGRRHHKTRLEKKFRSRRKSL